MAELCPCGTGVPYAECCGRLHDRTMEAPTAVALMRSRYSAFVLDDREYLLWSWHPDLRPSAVSVLGDEQWTGLEIVATRAGGVEDDTGTVEFRAHFVSAGAPRTLHEVSRFVRLDGRWVYLKGRDVSLSASRFP